MERESEVKTVLVNYQCDDCGGDVEYKDGSMILTDPPQFKHICVSCEKEYLFANKYPYQKFYVLNN